MQIATASAVLAASVGWQYPLAVAPAVILAGWFAYRTLIELIADRRAWEQMLAISEALSDHDLTTVLRTATHGAARIFLASVVDIDLQTVDQERRLVRAREGTPYDGPTDKAPTLAQRPSRILTLSRPGFRLEFRLHFERQALSKRRTQALKSFTAIVSTAVDNALKYQIMKHQALHDALTGLPNRRGLTDQLERDLGGSSHKLAVSMLNIDNFGDINNTFGRTAGDGLLQRIGQKILPQADESHFAARVGGDSFALVVQDMPTEEMLGYTQRVLNRVRHAIDMAGILVAVRASAGLTLSKTEDTATTIIDRAADALGRAKRDAFPPLEFFVDDTPTEVTERARELLAELPDAIRTGQIRIAYAPVVDLVSGSPVAIEVEPYWLHPTHGRIPSWEWSDLAKRAGLVGDLTAESLRQALLAAGTWRASGFTFPVSLTLSGEELSLDHRLPARVFSQLLSVGATPDQLILQVAETDPISDSYILDELRAGGVMLALRHFGSGRCSLATLGRIPVQGVMIDRLFVSDLHSRPATVVITAAVVLGGDLGINVAAEGIESHQQRVLLASMGCRFGQGSLMGHHSTLTELLVALKGADGTAPGHLLPELSAHDLVVPLSTRRAA
ncbi:EAL domain-containing protein [Micromonospora rubida]|uniref:EAL domain-containing protein n=1 Tax=Micromonospora rubida TaxID=2697657 RepID=A0ABW7SX80_9ACTN